MYNYFLLNLIMLKKKIINLLVNGKRHKIYFSKKLTIQHLLTFLSYNSNLNIVEYNGKIIKKNFYKTTYLLNNSNVEIITVVGGG